MEYNVPDMNVSYIAKARELYAKRNDIAYLYGAKGQKCTWEVFNSLWDAEPDYFDKYNAIEKNAIWVFCQNKTVMDCSGFINAITGKYNYSTGYINDCVNRTTPKCGVDGNLLYTTFGGNGRHIGIDIGHGFFMHCPSEKKTLEIGVIDNYPWEDSGTLE